MHKVIIDTNIWISFLISKSLVGLHKFIYDNRIQLITCNEQLEELLEVLGRKKMKKYFIKEQVVELLELISIKAIIIEIKSNLQVCRDKKDDYLLNLAIDSSADFLISGDKDLLILNQVDKTKVIKLVDFEKDVLSGL